MMFTFRDIYHDSVKNEIINHIIANIPGSEFKITEEPDNKIESVEVYGYESNEGLDYHIYKIK